MYSLFGLAKSVPSRTLLENMALPVAVLSPHVVGGHHRVGQVAEAPLEGRHHVRTEDELAHLVVVRVCHLGGYAILTDVQARRRHPTRV